jgi:DNA topoisomerase-2
MDPFWYGFEGSVVKIDETNYEIYGRYEIRNNKLIITELPVGESTNGFKEYLENLLVPEEKTTAVNKSKGTKKKVVKTKSSNPFLDYKENNTDTKVYFELEFESGYLESAKDLDKTFHLCKKYSTNNMHLFDANGVIKKYDSPVAIMDEYYKIRLELYGKRKAYELDVLEYQLKVISNKVKFIMMIVDKKLIINNKKRSELETELEKLKFDKLGKNKADYDYLLSMPIYNLTIEKIEELKKQEKDKETEYEELDKLSIEQIWLNELNKLEKEYEKFVNNKMKDSQNHKKEKKEKKSKK